MVPGSDTVLAALKGAAVSSARNCLVLRSTCAMSAPPGSLDAAIEASKIASVGAEGVAVGDNPTLVHQNPVMPAKAGIVVLEHWKNRHFRITDAYCNHS